MRRMVANQTGLLQGVNPPNSLWPVTIDPDSVSQAGAGRLVSRAQAGPSRPAQLPILCIAECRCGGWAYGQSRA